MREEHRNGQLAGLFHRPLLRIELIVKPPLEIKQVRRQQISIVGDRLELEPGWRVQDLWRFVALKEPKYLAGWADLIEAFVLLQRVIQRERRQQRIDGVGQLDVLQQRGGRQRTATGNI